MGVENPPHLDKVDYATRVYFDDVLGIAGTEYPVGTPSVPSNSAANTKTIADALKLRDIHVHGVFTVPDIMEHYCFYGAEHEDITDQINLNSKDVDSSNIAGLVVTGTQAGTGFLTLIKCVLNALLDFQGRADFCDLYGSTMRIKDGGYVDLHLCKSIHGIVTITVQAPTWANFGEISGNFILTAQDGGVLYLDGFKGNLEIDAMTLGTLDIYANGANIQINADCDAPSEINIYGNARVTIVGAPGATINDHTKETQLDTIEGVVDAILVDTETTLEDKLDAIGGIVADILEDTGTDLEAKLDALYPYHGLVYYGLVTGIVNAPKFQCSGLIGFGDNFFKDYWAYVVWDDGGAGGAPQGEMLQCTGYVSVDGDLTVAAYSVAIAVGDIVLLLHPAIAAAINTTYGLSAIKDLIDAIEAKVEANVIGRSQIFEKSITSAANAGDVVVATITDQPCLIESIVLHADTVQTGDLTSAGIFGGAAKVITFIAAADALQADLDAIDKQVYWEGPVRLAATKTIVISLVGTGVTPVDLTVTIKYRACISGGYLV